MSIELLLLAVLASMSCVALMIAINSRGRWRATLSSLMAVCMLGGTIWVFTLQYNLADAFEVPADRAERPRSERARAAEQHQEQQAGELAKELARLRQEKAGNAAMMNSLIAEATEFSAALMRERLHDPLFSHGQLVARATAAEQRFEALQREINGSTLILENYPAAAKLLGEAMGDLRAACHFYRAYYFAENTDGEIRTERLLRERAKSAHETLLKAKRAVADNG